MEFACIFHEKIKILVLSCNVGFHDRTELLYLYRVPATYKITDCPFKIIHGDVIAKVILHCCLSDIQQFFLDIIDLALTACFETVSIIAAVYRNSMNKRLPVRQAMIIFLSQNNTLH